MLGLEDLSTHASLLFNMQMDLVSIEAVDGPDIEQQKLLAGELEDKLKATEAGRNLLSDYHSSAPTEESGATTSVDTTNSCPA